MSRLIVSMIAPMYDELQAIVGGRGTVVRTGFKKTVLIETDDPPHVAASLLDIPWITAVADGEDPIIPAGLITKTFTEPQKFIDTNEPTYLAYASQNPATARLKQWSRESRTIRAHINDARLGDAVIFAIVDGGVISTHPEFSKNPSRITNVYDAHGDGQSDHGTACAAFCAGDNMGFCPEADILNIKVLNEGGSGSSADLINGLSSLLTWVENNQVTIGDRKIIVNIGLSASGTVAGNPYGSIIQELSDEGLVCFMASGNDGADLDSVWNAWPAESGGVYAATVGATSPDGSYVGFSNWGSMVKFWAPGHRVWRIYGAVGYAQGSGTSFACPIMAGCFGSWVADRWKPANKEDVAVLLLDFEQWCQEGKYGTFVKDHQLNPTGEAFSRSEISDLQIGKALSSHQKIVITTGIPSDGVMVRTQKIAIIMS